MKPQYQRVVDLIQTLAPVWQERMALHHVDIEHVFLDEFENDDNNSQQDFKTTAVTEARWNYFMAKVKWYLPSCARADDEALEKILVHELCHVLLAPEQALIDNRLFELQDARSETERDVLEALYYERMEMATEMAARAMWQAYSPLAAQP